MKVRFWGARGSIPTPGPETIRYGGNTACVEVTADDGRLFIFDAGTGIRKLGHALMQGDCGKGCGHINLFISHTHWDHIQGFPFFAPLFNKGNTITIHGMGSSEKNLKSLLSGQMQFTYFPVILDHLDATINFEQMVRDIPRTIDGMEITGHMLNHPGGSLAYRFRLNGKTCIYATDTEPFREALLASSDEKQTDDAFSRKIDHHITALEQEYINFFKDADLLIYDSQYTAKEYRRFIGFGHTYVDYAVRIATAAQVKQLVLFHHDPNHDDNTIDTILADARKQVPENGPRIIAAIEGMELTP